MITIATDLVHMCSLFSLFLYLLPQQMYCRYLKFSLQSNFDHLNFFAWEGSVSKWWTFFDLWYLPSYIFHPYYLITNYEWGYKSISILKPLDYFHFFRKYLRHTKIIFALSEKCEDSGFPPMVNTHILQYKLLFCSSLMTHRILIVHIYSIQFLTRKGFLTLERIHLYFLHLIFLLLTFTNHDIRVCIHFYSLEICLFYNKQIKSNSLAIFLKAVILAYFVFISKWLLIPFT